jgi:hypothetical protein
MTMRLAGLPLLIYCTLSSAMAQHAPLVPGTGEDVAEAACQTCHSLSYIPMNSRFMTADIWKAEVTKMRTAFGAPIDDDAANTIIAYLTANYGAAQK